MEPKRDASSKTTKGEPKTSAWVWADSLAAGDRQELVDKFSERFKALQARARADLEQWQRMAAYPDLSSVAAAWILNHIRSAAAELRLWETSLAETLQY
jgi:hypothetical protein